MRTLRIRTFLLLCLCCMLTLPWIFYVAAHYAETKTFRLSDGGRYDETLQAHLNDIIRLIETDADQWRDPEWQNRLTARLRSANMEAAIVSAADQDIYRSSSERRSAMTSAESFSIIADGRLLGRVTVYWPKPRAVQMVSLFAGLLLASLIVGMGMKRLVLRPLESMSAAARQMAGGDWEVRLPVSRMKEIADVRDGFEVMVSGLQASSRKQTELEEERRFVIAALAHDLRTPLFALRGYLDGLEQGIARTPDKIAKYVAVCKEKAAQLNRLVEELFTFTKGEYAKTQLNAKPVDLAYLLRRAVDSLNPLAGPKQLALHCQAIGSCTVNGDSHLLERAMNNLLDNAVRHTPPNGEVWVRCDSDGGKVRFTIRDTGPGFAEEEMQRVFEPLFRGEASRNRSTGGSGLGLTISRRIMRLHGGDLEASNHEEGGALLAGWLPAASGQTEQQTSD